MVTEGVFLRLLAGNCSYWLPIKNGWVTSALQAAQWHQLPSHKKITSSYVTTTDAATPPLWCWFGVKTRQGHKYQTKVRWLVVKHDNKRCWTNYCHKNRGKIWRRLGQIWILAFGRAVIHQQAHQQGLEFWTCFQGWAAPAFLHISGGAVVCFLCGTVAQRGGWILGVRLILRLIIKAG